MARFFIKNKEQPDALVAVTFLLNTDSCDIEQQKVGLVQFKDLSEISDDAEIIEEFDNLAHQTSGKSFKAYASAVFPTFKRFI